MNDDSEVRRYIVWLAWRNGLTVSADDIDYDADGYTIDGMPAEDWIGAMSRG